MKYIFFGGWFLLEYLMGWYEFEDIEESFLFYNFDWWIGNFCILVYKDEVVDYGLQCIVYELKENIFFVLVKVGKWDCVYSVEIFQEEGVWYIIYIWVIGEGDFFFECFFIVFKGGDKYLVEEIIWFLQVCKEGVSYLCEIILICVLEIGEVNIVFEWVFIMIKK